MFSIKKLLKVGLILLSLLLAGIYSLYLSIRSDLPSVQSLKDLHWQTPLQIFSQDGLLISQFGEKKRSILTLEQVPQELINALLATEDDRFYLHFGVDPIGMGRAVLGKLMGQDKGGASTITMQVARNFFLTREVTYTRKIREIFLSFHIENLLSKDEILMLYINKIELGHRAFGFGAAAQVYYGKEINELNLAQIAVLAGLPKAPSTLNPIRSPKRAKARRSVVLYRMLVSGYITEQEYKTAKAAPITGKRHGAEIELDAPYIAEMAHKEILQRYGKEKAYTEGYKVFTTVTKKLQTAAQQALVNNLLAYDQRHGYRGPSYSLRPQLVASSKDLDNSQVSPLTQEEISAALSKGNYYQMLVPAVVTSVEDKSVTIQLRNEVTARIEWQGLAWARAYINDQKQGIPPKTAAEVLQYGDVILVSKMSDETYRLGQLPTASAAIVSLSPDDGAIKAAVGGFSFKQSQFNRVTQAKRQVGSNIKPFIYSAALENGFTLSSLINDAPINQWDKSSGGVWRPRNSPETYVGPIRVRRALAQSKNVIAVRLLQNIGVSQTIEYLTTFGFDAKDLPRDETLALGSASLTPLEVATGFATFANGGFLIKPYLIERIENSDGEIIFQADPALACDPCINISELEKSEQYLDSTSTDITVLQNSISEFDDEYLVEQPVVAVKQAPRVISAQNAFLITQALNSVIWGSDWSHKPGWQGTGWRAQKLKRRDIAGKTGTTNEAKDAWFSGFSRRLITTSWIGFDDPTHILGRTVYNNNLGKIQTTGPEWGGITAQPAWIDFMKIALADLEVEPFQPPVDIVTVRIDKASGKLTT
ncbi:MAG: penicillin-binding protein 1A, partial [Colwellia sp.]|nr:penicillin-binding protein 1A [Colwellia sp.]